MSQDCLNRLMTELIWIILIIWRSCSYAQDFDLELETGVFPVSPYGLALSIVHLTHRLQSHQAKQDMRCERS